MDVYLVRHGQSEANARLSREMDSRLTPIGRRQAQLTGERLRSEGFTHIYVSPFRRTLETAEPICRATGLPAHANPWVCEFFSDHVVDGRDFQGLSAAEIGMSYPHVQFTSSFPGSGPWWPEEIEDTPQLIARASRVRDYLLDQHGKSDARVLIISHAEPIGRLIECLQRIPPTPDRPPWTDNCGISRLHVDRDPDAPAILVDLNNTEHLGDLLT